MVMLFAYLYFLYIGLARSYYFVSYGPINVKPAGGRVGAGEAGHRAGF